ncbi:MAG: hypothetical protein HRU40_05745 [Saprospiraceae bacterium]|nr:hypothetical protein [Saprospiraceae bacterium]
MKSLWLLLVFILSASSVHAQLDKKQVFLQSRMRSIASTNGDSNGGVFAFSEVVRRKGHRFLFDDFVKGRVLFVGYEYLSEEVDMVIDGEFERLYLLFEDETEGLLPLSQIQRVEIYHEEGDTLHFIVQNLAKISQEGEKGLRFYQRIYESDRFVVLHHERKFLRKEEYMENVGIVRRPDEYKSLHSYYLIHEGELHKIRKSRSKIEAALPKYKRTIRLVEKETKNKLKNETDLNQFFTDLDARIR